MLRQLRCNKTQGMGPCSLPSSFSHKLRSQHQDKVGEQFLVLFSLVLGTNRRQTLCPVALERRIVSGRTILGSVLFSFWHKEATDKTMCQVELERRIVAPDGRQETREKTPRTATNTRPGEQMLRQLRHRKPIKLLLLNERVSRQIEIGRAHV